jgi:hypothetical protein
MKKYKWKRSIRRGMNTGDIFEEWQDYTEPYIADLLEQGYIEEVTEESPVDEILGKTYGMWSWDEKRGIAVTDHDKLAKVKQALCKAQIEYLKENADSWDLVFKAKPLVETFWGVEEEE